VGAFAALIVGEGGAGNVHGISDEALREAKFQASLTEDFVDVG
jgi:hypothetical protein